MNSHEKKKGQNTAAIEINRFYGVKLMNDSHYQPKGSYLTLQHDSIVLMGEFFWRTPHD